MTDDLPSAPTTLYARGHRSMAAVQQLRFYPLAVVGGDGCWLIEDSGRRVLDLSATWAAASLGYGHPAVVHAIGRAVGDPGGAGYGSICTREAVELAEDLLEIVPGDGERRVYLGHSGSDANEAVIRAIGRATARRGLIAFHGSYHGGLAGSSAFSGLMLDSGSSTNADVTLVDYPNPYRHDPARIGAIIDDLRSLLLGHVARTEIGAVLVEPIMSDGGLVVPPAGFLQALADICRQADVVLVCDEVKVGLGRTGLMHAFEVDDVIPDVVTFGKGLGSGLPISAAVGPASILDVDSASTMLTTAGNPICSAAARAVLATIKGDRLVEHAAQVGEHFRSGLDEIKQRHHIVGHVRGRGLAIGVELVRDTDTHAIDATLAAKVVFRAWQRGLVFFYVGTDSNVLELTPPLIISEEQITLALEILDDVLTDVEDGRVSDDAIADYQGW